MALTRVILTVHRSTCKGLEFPNLGVLSRRDRSWWRLKVNIHRWPIRSARIRDINPRQMRPALHQGSPTCRRFHRRVVEYACGTRPSPEPVTVGPASDCCWNHLWQKVVGDFMPQCGGVVCGCFDRCGGGETPRGSGKGQSNGPARLAAVQLFSLSQPR